MQQESKRYHQYVQYFQSDTVRYRNIMCDELKMSRVLCLAYVLNLIVQVAIKTDSAASLVPRVGKVHSFCKAPESMATLK